MIYRRAIAKLRAQDWMAITIEVAVVIVGVFIGTWVNDLSQREAEKREIGRLLEQMRPEATGLLASVKGMRAYYATTDAYAHVALAAWNGDHAIDDRQFVIAAYQASQIVGADSESQSFASVLGGDQVRKIDDPALRRAIARILRYDYAQISPSAMQTSYRDDVRATIPLQAQEAIRSRCGDTMDSAGHTLLPSTCDAALTAADAKTSAEALRSRPELPRELTLHQSRVATFLYNIARLEHFLQDVRKLDR